MTDANPEEMQERLDALADEIDATRRKAEEDGLLPDTTPEPTFIDPDADGRRDDADEDPNATTG